MSKHRGFEIVLGYENVAILPTRATGQSAGYDLYSAELVSINMGEMKIIHTGIKSYMQSDDFLQVSLRSSMCKRSLIMPNGVGVIDSDYYNNPSNEGIICVPIVNFSNGVVVIGIGDKIAQGIFMKYNLVDNDDFNGKKREGGFGSTDIIADIESAQVKSAEQTVLNNLKKMGF